MTEATSKRKIIHVDFDAFFASIEIRDNPKLSNQPIAVGGSPHRRGVISTCNYVARTFGVRSAMASAHAIRLCPQLQIIAPRFSVYKLVSNEAHEILHQYTDIIEPISLDEAYLDVTESNQYQGSATHMAQAIRKDIKQQLGITLSAGVAPNKFLAKIASDWKKPDGLFVITPTEAESFTFELPVKKIHGVGAVTAKKLDQKGIITCGQLRQYSKLELHRWFGRFGEKLWHLSRGIDSRPVEANRRRKSQSVEQTYEQDLQNLADIQTKIPALVSNLEQRYQRIHTEYRATQRIVKIKFSDFSQTTLEERIKHGQPIATAYFQRLIESAWRRKQQPVRLLGVGVKLEDLKPPDQLTQLELYPKD